MSLAVSASIVAFALALAFGFRGGMDARDDRAIVRDGSRGAEPSRNLAQDRAVRATRTEKTAYGPVVVTELSGSTSEQPTVRGLNRYLPVGSVLVSTAMRDQMNDDWSGELEALVAVDEPLLIPEAALSFPDELVIIKFVERPTGDDASRFSVVGQSGRSETTDPSVVIVGLMVLILPAMALALAAVRLHVSTRRARYALLRVLGLTPARTTRLILAEIAISAVVGSAAGVVGHRVAFTLLDRFQFGGNSYWASDLVVSVTGSLVIVACVTAMFVLAAARTARRTSRNALSELRIRRTRTRRWIAVGAVLGPVVLLTMPRWLPEPSAERVSLVIALSVVLTVVGLIGMARLAVSMIGRVMLARTSNPISGSRMLHAAADTLAGAAAAAVAVLLVTFTLVASINRAQTVTSRFDVFIELPGVSNPSAVVERVRSTIDVNAVSVAGRSSVDMDGDETSLYIVTCADLVQVAEIDGPCKPNELYGPAQLVVNGTASTLVDTHPNNNGEINGTYTIAGAVKASWLVADEFVLTLDRRPKMPHAVLFVFTGGSPSAMRVLYDITRDGSMTRDGNVVPSVMTAAALGSPTDFDTVVVEPYLVLMSSAAALVAAAAIAFAVVGLHRQRGDEFRMVRCLGSTPWMLARDLTLMYLIPFVVGIMVALGLGVSLALAYNSAFDVSHRDLGALLPILVVVAIGAVITGIWVVLRGLATPPTLFDPDASL